LGNPGLSGASGIIRDAHGNVVHAFASHLGNGSNNRAELLALLLGLRHCKQLGVGSMEIEMDSQVVISWLQRRRCGIWYLEDFWEELISLIDSMVCMVRMCTRKGMRLQIG
jgi:hypothetical protein